jgi:hypothetical protein
MLALCLLCSGARLQAQDRPFPKALLTYPTPMDPDDIGGVVSSLQGAEAGVWVIAETIDLPTRLVRIVLTDDGGRYLLPDLPKAAYQVFVKGNGLEDAKRSKAWPGQQLFFGVTASATRDRAKTRPTGADRNVVITIWDDNGSPDVPKAPAGDGQDSTTTRSWTVPYPAELVVWSPEERVDDAATGWKGRGFWGKAPGKILRFQVRPNPLAR